MSLNYGMMSMKLTLGISTIILMADHVGAVIIPRPLSHGSQCPSHTFLRGEVCGKNRTLAESKPSRCGAQKRKFGSAVQPYCNQKGE